MTKRRKKKKKAHKTAQSRWFHFMDMRSGGKYRVGAVEKKDKRGRKEASPNLIVARRALGSSIQYTQSIQLIDPWPAFLQLPWRFVRC